MIREIRHQKIIQLITQHQGMSVAELRAALQVSAMTLHRDLSSLESRGLLRRVHGGVVIRGSDENAAEICAHCGKTVSSRTRMLLFGKNGEKALACCAHCGMGLMRLDSSLSAGLGVDFIHETVIDIPHAYFLVEPQVRVCCEPTILVFARQEDAERMQKGFGGKMMKYAELYACFVDAPENDSSCADSD